MSVRCGAAPGCRGARRPRHGVVVVLARTVGSSRWMDRPANRGYFVTLTAPGEDMSWDRAQCVHPVGVPCSGALGSACEVDARIGRVAPRTLGSGGRGSCCILVASWHRRAAVLQSVRSAASRCTNALHVISRFVGAVTDRRIHTLPHGCVSVGIRKAAQGRCGGPVERTTSSCAAADTAPSTPLRVQQMSNDRHDNGGDHHASSACMVEIGSLG